MSTKKQTETGAGGKGKAATQRAADELTPERIRAILESPDVTERAENSITNAVGRLYVAVEADTLPDGPEETFLEAEMALYLYLRDEGEQTEKARAAYSELAALVERHEPKDERTVRRLSEVLRDPTNEQIEAVIVAVNDLSNETPVNDTHPDIFPTLARVPIREARCALKGKGLDSHKRRILRDSLRALEGVADA